MVQTKAKKKSFSAKLTKEEKFYGRYMGGSPELVSTNERYW